MYNTSLVYRCFGDPLTTLQEETATLAPLRAGAIRVKMRFSPVNASDLIPIAGAYSHRITLPAIAGYEGVGVVTETNGSNANLLGTRVLPLRGSGTWQQYVDCPAELAVPVPDDIADTLAARAWINPFAAQMMLELYPVRGKHVLITAAGSDCAGYLAQWARLQGAKSVTGIYRSAIHAQRLAAYGIAPLADSDSAGIKQAAAKAAVVYDAVGGTLAETILQAMPQDGMFISYGLLSEEPFSIRRRLPVVHWFHIRNYLDAMPASAWQQAFVGIWDQLRNSQSSEVTLIDFHQWQQAIAQYHSAGRTVKPLLAF
ncbi:zinc-dependent alcohol dehydrogenase family protein [Enterobacter sp. Bisph1]|uniref:zinc-dependent alcohol dehydrogenase family protein n=1 Tax=Enterobacter sp. Bisph1 TaxID=1274399 RepID=UPI00057BE91B|nr:zinc-dependent alcohol dehydrogenase family protein [Enterobacter sp. Bisph1]